MINCLLWSREIDIAMSKLFGGFSNQFYESYNEKFPLEKDGNLELIYGIFIPFLVHANLFGDSYLNQVNFILKNLTKKLIKRNSVAFKLMHLVNENFINEKVY